MSETDEQRTRRLAPVNQRRRERIIRIGQESSRIEGELRTHYLTMLRASGPQRPQGAERLSIPKESGFLILALAEFLATERNPPQANELPWCDECWRLQRSCRSPQCPLLTRPKV